MRVSRRKAIKNFAYSKKPFEIGTEFNRKPVEAYTSKYCNRKVSSIILYELKRTGCGGWKASEEEVALKSNKCMNSRKPYS